MTRRQQGHLRREESLKKRIHDRFHTRFRIDCEYCRKQRQEEEKGVSIQQKD